MLTPGEILKNKRKSLGKTIFEVSQETRMLEKYIKQIEANQFEEFDSPVFARGFIKIYAQYLDLDEEKILALFRRENKELNTKNELKKKNSIGLKGFNSTKSILIAITTLIFISVFALIYYQLYLFQLKPKLEVYSPISGFVTEKKDIEIIGLTNKNSKVDVNNDEITTNKGSFQSNRQLTLGENIFTIKAINRKNPTKYSEVIVKVTYNEPKITKPQVKPITISIEIDKESTWTKLNIDGLQKLAQVISPNFSKKYTVTNDFEIVTGRPDQLILTIDKVRRNLKINDKTGVATLKCTIKDIELECTE